MEAKAYLRYVRISPRKIQIVCVNAAQMKITSIPAPMRTQLEALQ